MCASENWWQSVFGQCICRVCHPPAEPSLEEGGVGDTGADAPEPDAESEAA